MNTVKLYHDNKIWVIDVAQAVEDDHPNALYFLKRDCININNYFENKGVEVITSKQLFNIISSFMDKGNKNQEDDILNDNKNNAMDN